MFAGSDNGGDTAAILFTFTATCRRLKVDPFSYLRDVLSRILSHAPEKLAELLPDRWARAQLEAITITPPPGDTSDTG